MSKLSGPISTKLSLAPDRARAPRRLSAGLLLGALALTGCVPLDPAGTTPTTAASATAEPSFAAHRALPPPPGARQVLLAKLVSKLPRGTTVGAISLGWRCAPAEPLRWPLGLDEPVSDDVLGVLRDALKHSGYARPAALFEESEDAQPELLLGGSVRALRLNACNGPQGKSTALSVEIEWQLYDRRTRAVIFQALTGGSAQSDDLPTAYRQGYVAALQNLLARDVFTAALTGASAAPSDPTYPALSLSVGTAPADPARTSQQLQRAQHAVVRILRSGGHGSGVIVSPTGAVLTAAHVVAGLTGPITVELADGRRVTASLARAHHAADVALLQLPAGTYDAAAVASSSSLQVGGPVFAIGTPLQARFGRSVTKGVVSALRPEAGRTAIQSDVVVHAGSSGGPLLDEHGRVIGLTISGATIGGGIGVGLNTFLGLDDAWRALHIEPQLTLPALASK